MTADPNLDANLIEQARRQINRLAEEIAHLSEMDLPPAEYYGEFLQRVLTAIAAPAGAVWLRTPQGNLQLQFQSNMRQVGLDRSETSRQSHDELLRQAAMRGQPGMLAPQSGLGTPEGGAIAPGNPTDFVVLLAPILVEKQVAGLVEVWQDPNRGTDAQRGFLQFVVRMAGLASSYTRNLQLRQMSGQQQVWTQLESFTRQIHTSLNPTEVAYLVANEGRRLVECDRVSVALRLGKRTRIEAISGADVVEKRSNLVQLMRALCDRVIHWGEKLVYSGTKDDTLPPKVLAALDAYLAESNSKLLVLLPLRDEREAESKRPPRSALLMESFEPAVAPEQMVARLEVIGKHSASALYNATEHRRIPMRFIWMPLAKVQEGLGGKARAIISLVAAALVLLVLAMIFVPYPLKMDAKGQLLPVKRAHLYSPVEAAVVDWASDVRPGGNVAMRQEVVLMRSLELGSKIRELLSEINTAKQQMDQLRRDIQTREKDVDLGRLKQDLIQAEITFYAKSAELQELRERTNAVLRRPGEFWLRSPIKGIILTSDFRETLTNRYVKPNEPILRIGDANTRNPHTKDWEIELKIPQKHIGQVLSAYPANDPRAELDVDILLVSRPTQTFKGKLARGKISSEANPDRNEHNEAEPVVVAWVRVDGNDIPKDAQLPTELLLTGTEVHTRIRCGNRAMGYSLFYGVWEFVYEKVVFFF